MKAGRRIHEAMGLLSHAAFLTAEVIAYFILITGEYGMYPFFRGCLESLKWYTIQSNLLCMLVMAGALAGEILSLCGRKALPPWFYRLKAAAAVNIMLVFVIFSLLYANGIQNFVNLMHHFLGPCWFLADTLLFDRPGCLRPVDTLWAIIPPVWYLLFSYCIYIPLTGIALYPEILEGSMGSRLLIMGVILSGVVGLGLLLWGTDRLKVRLLPPNKKTL